MCLFICQRRKCDHQSCLFPFIWKLPLSATEPSSHRGHSPLTLWSKHLSVFRKLLQETEKGCKQANLLRHLIQSFLLLGCLPTSSPFHLLQSLSQWPLVKLPCCPSSSPAGQSFGLVSTPGDIFYNLCQILACLHCVAGLWNSNWDYPSQHRWDKRDR